MGSCSSVRTYDHNSNKIAPEPSDYAESNLSTTHTSKSFSTNYISNVKNDDALPKTISQKTQPLIPETPRIIITHPDDEKNDGIIQINTDISTDDISTYAKLHHDVAQNLEYHKRISTKLHEIPNDADNDIKSNEVELFSQIGEGQFGKVFSGICRKTCVAVKIIKIDSSNYPETCKFQTELNIMKKIIHENICSYMGSCITHDDNLMIIMPLYKMSLNKILYDDNIHITLTQRVRIAIDIATGMNWLHMMTPKIIHSDLKSDNVLLDENFRASISDFGQSHLLCSTDTHSHGGTPIYASPEKLLHKKFNEKSDVYSFGLLLWELIYRKIAFINYLDGTQENIDAFIKNICNNGERPHIDGTCPDAIASLIIKCWNQDPQIRPSFNEIIDIINNLIFDIAIPEVNTADFWRRNFGNNVFVCWSCFKRILKHNIHNDSLFWIKQLIADYCDCKCVLVDESHYSNNTSTIQKREEYFVTMEKFGNMISYFGSFSRYDSKKLTDVIRETLTQPWFHGDISKSKTEKLIEYDFRVGVFLVRFDMENNNGFIISHVIQNDKHKKIIHEKVATVMSGGVIFMDNYYNSLTILINSLADVMNLIYPISGSKYISSIELWKLKHEPKTINDDFEEFVITQ